MARQTLKELNQDLTELVDEQYLRIKKLQADWETIRNDRNTAQEDLRLTLESKEDWQTALVLQSAVSALVVLGYVLIRLFT